MRALNGADQLNGPRQWGSLLFYLVIVLSLQRAEGSTEETGSSYTKIPILPVGSFGQLRPNAWPVLPQVALGVVDGHPIDTRTALVLANAFPRSYEILSIAHL